MKNINICTYFLFTQYKQYKIRDSLLNEDTHKKKTKKQTNKKTVRLIAKHIHIIAEHLQNHSSFLHWAS